MYQLNPETFIKPWFVGLQDINKYIIRMGDKERTIVFFGYID